ncbi:MAG: FAD-dependent monooxygenase [Burkholderiales bacterium]
MSERYDLAVIGGGPVGAALALQASRSGLRVRVLESRRREAAVADNRPMALSYGSRLVLERLGVWRELAPVTPIARIHVSQTGGFGRTEMTAGEAGLPALGYVVDYACLVNRFDTALEHAPVEVTRGAKVTSIAHDADSARIEFQQGAALEDCVASVVALADGGSAALDVGVRTRDYDQVAITARLVTVRAHGGTAYERFTPTGPIALLPFGTDYALVWTLAPVRGELLWTEGEHVFLCALRDAFGERAGRFASVTERHIHPLRLRVAESVTIGRMALVGNAAQSLHPVGGQGFNLGLRDAWELGVEIARLGPQAPDVLYAYARRRRLDRTAGIAFTDAVVKIFSNDNTVVRMARGAGLTALDCIAPAKDFLVRRMIFGARG